MPGRCFPPRNLPCPHRPRCLHAFFCTSVPQNAVEVLIGPWSDRAPAGRDTRVWHKQWSPEEWATWRAGECLPTVWSAEEWAAWRAGEWLPTGREEPATWESPGQGPAAAENPVGWSHWSQAGQASTPQL